MDEIGDVGQHYRVGEEGRKCGGREGDGGYA